MDGCGMSSWNQDTARLDPAGSCRLGCTRKYRVLPCLANLPINFSVSSVFAADICHICYLLELLPCRSCMLSEVGQARPHL